MRKESAALSQELVVLFTLKSFDLNYKIQIGEPYQKPPELVIGATARIFRGQNELKAQYRLMTKDDERLEH